jgi:flagellin-like hook-associated protein FlgL
MRITQSLVLRHQAESLSGAYSRLFQVQAQLASGKRVLKASDEPSAIRPLLDLHSARREIAQILRNSELASSELGTADGLLGNASDVIARAMEIAVSGASGSLNQGDRDGLAIEVDGLLEQILAVANSRGLNGFLFGGGLTSSAPFVTQATADGTIVRYAGDRNSTSVTLGAFVKVDLGVPGSEVFGLGDRGTTIYGGLTGAAAGGGNDSARGSDHLTVAHVRTILGDGALGGTGDSASGLQAGASSAALDTVLGLSGAHSITLVDTSGTGASGTVLLDDGTAVNWTSADTDLAVTAANGDVVHLDLSNVAANFNGTVAVAGEGTLSLDGGLTTVAIDFTQQDQLVVDSETGGSIFVDARGIARSGSELLRFPGAYDLFAALTELADALRNGDGLPLDDQLARISATITEFQSGQDRILAALSSLGARQRLVETTRARTAELDILLAENQSALEDVDFAAATAELSQAELVLQAGVAVSARLANLPSLVQLL